MAHIQHIFSWLINRQQQLNQVEEEWFELQEQLEQQTNDFWAKNA